MLDLIYKLYNRDFKHGKIDSYYKRICIRLSNIIFYLYCKSGIGKRPKLTTTNHKLNNSDTYIVSLTTFPPRINHVWLTIESILRQTSKPDAIILWLYKGEFPEPGDLPKNLLELKKRGVQIRFCDENLKPHKKYYYTLKEYPEANIVTVDDDIIYPPDLLEKLKAYQRRFPDTICCSIARRIEVEGVSLSLYKNWKVLRENAGPSYRNLQIGAGGVLYPPGSLDPEVLNKQVFENLAMNADDLWLKVMSVKNKTKITCIGSEYNRQFIPIIIKNNQELMDANIAGGGNDKVIRDILSYYQIPELMFKNSTRTIENNR